MHSLLSGVTLCFRLTSYGNHVGDSIAIVWPVSTMSLPVFCICSRTYCTPEPLSAHC